MKTKHKAKQKIYCFGNLDLKDDRSALDIADILSKENDLKQFEFIKCTSPDFLLTEEVPDQLIIIDVVKDIKDIKLITDIDDIKHTKTTSVHDFDLANTLKLLKSLGKLDKVVIIGIPYAKKIDKKDIELIIRLVSSSIH